MPISEEAAARSHRMLRTALGPQIAAWLDDPNVSEVLLNPDGRLWLDRLQGGLVDAGAVMGRGDAERVIRLAAHHVSGGAHLERSRLSAELPSGERFEGLLPPLATAPVFAIRKPARQVFGLGDYVRAGVMSERQARVLAGAVGERRTVLVVGPTASGKTTLVNALLAEMSRTGDRLVLIEDVRELQCSAPNAVALRTVEHVASLGDLVRAALRLRPDRIVIGEVRGGEALDLLKAWGTGHPGGVGTLHAGSAAGALRRLEQLVQETAVAASPAMIAESLDLIAVISGRGEARRLVELAWVQGLDGAGAYRLAPADLAVAA